MNLTHLDWQLSGWLPWQWALERSVELGELQGAEVAPFAISLPSSVQKGLREQELIPDWNIGLNHRLCDWVENRHWVFDTHFTAPGSGDFELFAEGLDSAGWITLDGKVVGEFRGAFREHRVLFPPLEAGRRYRLSIVFDCPPRWLGQFGYTSKMPVEKPRFNYSWDWTARLVQLGITGPLHLRPAGEKRLKLHAFDTGGDSLELVATGVETDITATLTDGETVLFRETVRPGERLRRQNLPVTPWQPNGRGETKLYRLELTAAGCDSLVLHPGFRSIRRRPCAGAPEGAEPWLFEINGEPLFIQGINWTPIRPCTADVAPEEYRRRIDLYRQMGVNLFRIWGGARRESELFYRLCDEAGILVWQEFPLCSSGLDNLPPEDPESLAELARIADSYLDALLPHPSLALWCGGNELYYREVEHSTPCSGSEPALKLFADLLAERDPGRGYLPASPSGPSTWGVPRNFGKGIHHDVHGPWRATGADLDREWRSYWEADDALFRSEIGCPGASSPEVLAKYAGELNPMPVSKRNPFWSRPMDWWIEEHFFREEHGRPPETPEEYALWSRERQRKALSIAAGCIKRRFPAAGGLIFWMGHDSYPCSANSSLIDFEGNLKPAAFALAEVFGGNLPSGD